MKESVENVNFSEPQLITPEEWEKLKDIRTRAINDSPQAFGNTPAETGAREDSVWVEWATKAKNYIIENNGKSVAAATFRQDTDGTWIINGVWTDPAYRQQGLSKSLFERIFQDARESGILTIDFGVYPIQKEAVTFYESLGFEVIDHHEGHKMGDGQEHAQDVMRINLEDTD